MRKYFTISLLIFIGIILYITVTKITEKDNIDNQTYIFHTSSYIKERYVETNMKNIVEAILINYRSMDTLGGILILITSTISVISLLRSSFNDVVKTAPYSENIILRLAVVTLTPLSFIFSFYIFFYGDMLPGGGFQGGLMLGATIIIMGMSLGYENIEKKILLKFRILTISISFILTIMIGTAGLFFDNNFFSYNLPYNLNTILSKLIGFNIMLIVGMIISSLFYIMEGEKI